MVYTATITLSGTAHSLLEYLSGKTVAGADLSGSSQIFPQLRGGFQHLSIQALGNAQAIYLGYSSGVSSSNNGFTFPVVTSPSMTIYNKEAAVGHNPIDLAEYWLVAASSTPVVNVIVEKE